MLIGLIVLFPGYNRNTDHMRISVSADFVAQKIAHIETSLNEGFVPDNGIVAIFCLHLIQQHTSLLRCNLAVMLKIL